MKENMENPIQTAIKVLGGRWKSIILWKLKDGKKRFGELRRAIPEASQKMLTQQLRELEKDGLVHRKVYAEVPPKVEYSMTDYGKDSWGLLHQLFDWGGNHQRTSKNFPKDRIYVGECEKRDKV